MLRLAIAVMVLCGCTDGQEPGPDGGVPLMADNLDVKLGAHCTAHGTFCAGYGGVCTANPAVCRKQCTEGVPRCASGSRAATVDLLDASTPGCVCIPD